MKMHTFQYDDKYIKLLGWCVKKKRAYIIVWSTLNTYINIKLFRWKEDTLEELK